MQFEISKVDRREKDKSGLKAGYSLVTPQFLSVSTESMPLESQSDRNKKPRSSECGFLLSSIVGVSEASEIVNSHVVNTARRHVLVPVIYKNRICYIAVALRQRPQTL